MGTNIVVVQKGELTERSHRQRLCGGPILQDHGVSSTRHGVDARVLQGSDPGVGRQGIEEINLEELGNIRKKTKKMIHIF